MYHLVIKNLGVKRCIEVREKDDFKEGMYADCSLDHGCIPSRHIRDIRITCTGDIQVERTAGIYSD